MMMMDDRYYDEDMQSAHGKKILSSLVVFSFSCTRSTRSSSSHKNNTQSTQLC